MEKQASYTASISGAEVTLEFSSLTWSDGTESVQVLAMSVVGYHETNSSSISPVEFEMSLLRTGILVELKPWQYIVSCSSPHKAIIMLVEQLMRDPRVDISWVEKSTTET